MISMKDIAKKCNVSVATVSKALSDQPDISEITKKKICNVADEMGYLTNSVARALKTNKTYNLGVVYRDEGGLGLVHEFFTAVLNGFKNEAEKSGYDITFINNENIGSKSASYLQHCKYRGIDGILIACVDFNNPQILEVVSSSIPAVTIDHVFDHVPCVLSDNREGMNALVKYAYSKGHRKIAYIAGEKDQFVTEERVSSFLNTMKELNLSVPEEYLIFSRYYEIQSCFTAVERLLALRDRPTCIIFPDDFALQSGVNAIISAGLSIPEDISIIGYDGILLSQVMTPKITTYKQNADGLGKAAADVLIDFINNPDSVKDRQIYICGNLLEGESVKALEVFS
ncbi:MAG: LacI family DNA-binding transcriptional regulator [Eubacteriales bacterium]|nr:LacI family DNA-binding transcriptional regulator [Eubacteriales bacterium]